MSVKLDRINQSILLSLQKDARQPIASIAENAGISTSPCQKGIKQLESQKVVSNCVANIDLSLICTSVTFLAEVTLQEHTAQAFRKFEKVIGREETLIECYQVSGSYDYFTRFICRDIEDYKAITDRLLAESPIQSIQSHCVLSKVKRFSGYPLNYLLNDKFPPSEG